MTTLTLAALFFVIVALLKQYKPACGSLFVYNNKVKVLSYLIKLS